VFAKIFAQIYDSSLVENPELRFTFMDFLILADKNGVVDVTHEAIERRTNRPIEIIRKTITERPLASLGRPSVHIPREMNGRTINVRFLFADCSRTRADVRSFASLGKRTDERLRLMFPFEQTARFSKLLCKSSIQLERVVTSSPTSSRESLKCFGGIASC